MSVIKEYWRTFSIIIALIMILAVVIWIPGNNNSSNGDDGGNNAIDNINYDTTPTVSSYLSPPANGSCYTAVGMMYHADAKNITQDMSDQIDAFSTMTGKNQTVYFDAWGDLWDPSETYWQLKEYKPLLEEGKIKALGVNIWPCNRTLCYLDNYTVKQIANGSEDAFIIHQAKMVKWFGYPLFIRFGAEFNIYQGKTWEGQSNSSIYRFAENPTDFVNAWRHYVDVFRAQGVTNAIWMWNPNWADNGNHHYTEYYPGDSYVDWVGIDLYQYTNTSDPASMISGVYNEYSDQKPIAIVEWGTDWPNLHISDSERASFEKKFFDAVEKRPQIKMIDYWYYTVFKFDPTSTPDTAAMYKERIANSRYIGS